MSSIVTATLVVILLSCVSLATGSVADLVVGERILNPHSFHKDKASASEVSTADDGLLESAHAISNREEAVIGKKVLDNATDTLEPKSRSFFDVADSSESKENKDDDDSNSGEREDSRVDDPDVSSPAARGWKTTERDEASNEGVNGRFESPGRSVMNDFFHWLILQDSKSRMNPFEEELLSDSERPSPHLMIKELAGSLDKCLKTSPALTEGKRTIISGQNCSARCTSATYLNEISKRMKKDHDHLMNQRYPVYTIAGVSLSVMALSCTFLGYCGLLVLAFMLAGGLMTYKPWRTGLRGGTKGIRKTLAKRITGKGGKSESGKQYNELEEAASSQPSSRSTTSVPKGKGGSSASKGGGMKHLMFLSKKKIREGGGEMVKAEKKGKKSGDSRKSASKAEAKKSTPKSKGYRKKAAESSSKF